MVILFHVLAGYGRRELGLQSARSLVSSRIVSAQNTHEAHEYLFIITKARKYVGRLTKHVKAIYAHAYFLEEVSPKIRLFYRVFIF